MKGNGGDFRWTIEAGAYTDRPDATSGIELGISNLIQAHIIDLSPRREYEGAHEGQPHLTAVTVS